LLRAMVKSRVLVECAPADEWKGANSQPCYQATSEESEPDRILDLRRRYAFPDPDAGDPATDVIRELHSFKLSFCVAWTGYSDEQVRRISWLNGIVDYLEKHMRLGGEPRRAVVVTCSRYRHYSSNDQVDRIGDVLSESLEGRGQFNVNRVRNPRDPEDVLEALRGAMKESGEKGTVLFWFIGHGRSDQVSNDLHLLHSESKNSLGLEYSRIANAMK